MRKKLYNFSPSKFTGSRLLGWMTGLCLLSTSVGQAQVTSTVSIGSSTGTSSNLPITGYYGYSYSQQIYMASEVSSANVNGYISKIRFYVTNANMTGMANAKDWVVYLGNTTKTSFSGNTDWIPTTQMTSVFTGTVAYPGTSGWVEMILPTPFLYLAGKNLVVAVDENTPSYTASSLYWQSSSGTPTRSIYYYSDPNDANPASPPTANATTTSYANVQFDFTTLPPCTSAPAPGSTLSGTTTLCAGGTTTFSVQNNSDFMTYSGITYQWQMDDGSGSGFTNINGATDLTYAAPAMTTSAVYQCVVACGTNSTSATPVIITVNQLPNIVATPPSNAACNSGTIGLNVSGANTYTWSPSTGLSGPNGAYVVASPTLYTEYNVTGTDANGCVNSTTLSVTSVADLPVVPAKPALLCAPGTYTLDISSDIPVGNPAGWEFQWFDGAGAVVQAWSGFSTYNANNPVNGNYTYKVAIRNTACPTETSDTVAVDVTVGFGADVDTMNVNCNRPFGTFILSNIYGQVTPNQMAAYDFTSSTLNPTTETIAASAVIANGRCAVTPSATGIRGAFTVLNPTHIDAQELDVDFLLTMDQPINNYGTGGADGLAWSYGDDAAYSASGPAQNGFGSKLRISFDAADNGSNNGNAKGIYLVYGWTNTALEYGPASTQVIAYSTNTALWKLLTDVPVNVHISADGKLTLTVNGTVVFDKKQLPAAYVNANKSNWFHNFSAATGGDALRQAIDHLTINYKGRLAVGVAAGYSAAQPTTWQTSTVIDSLQVGLYDLWLANPNDYTCGRLLGTYEIKNINPVVNLGNDTSLCAGSNIVLDAGGPFVSYIWANGSAITQTISVNTPGTYAVNIVDTAGCPGSSVIHIGQYALPSASGIFSSASGGNAYFLSVMNPQNATTYDWNFGDGSTANGAPSTVTHTYPTNGTYTVTVVMNNANSCGTTTVTGVVNITVGIEEAATANGIRMYPNPANSMVTVSSDNGQNISEVSVFDVTGKLVYTTAAAASSVNIDVARYENGVYTIQIVSDKGMTHRRLMITH